MISQYADDETVRLAVETVLSSNEFAAFKDDVSIVAYDVFFEGAESAEVDVNKLASIALDQLAAVTESSELAEIAGFGIEVDEGLMSRPPMKCSMRLTKARCSKVLNRSSLNARRAMLIFRCRRFGSNVVEHQACSRSCLCS